MKRALHPTWLASLLVVGACTSRSSPAPAPYALTPPLGLPPVPIPPGDSMTGPKVELGRLLFYDRRVASQAQSACADCHLPEHGYAGREPTMAFHRNSPTVLNRAYGGPEFWDGSAGSSLEELVDGVLRFVNFGAPRSVAARLDEVPTYRQAFVEAFGRPPDQEAVVQALATYCRTLLAGGSPYDRFVAGDRGALSTSAQQGNQLFFGAAGCASCHAGPNFTDEQFHDIGIGQEDPQRRFYPADPHGKPEFPELGRFNITHRLEDRGAFKTPTLRELESTAPYMHDGRFSTLEEVVDYYDRGGLQALGMDSRIRPLNLSPADKADLVAFLRSLSSNAPVPPPPVLPPS
jgi:cytochrome c peroxidase